MPKESLYFCVFKFDIFTYKTSVNVLGLLCFETLFKTLWYRAENVNHGGSIRPIIQIQVYPNSDMLNLHNFYMYGHFILHPEPQ